MQPIRSKKRTNAGVITVVEKKPKLLDDISMSVDITSSLTFQTLIFHVGERYPGIRLPKEQAMLEFLNMGSPCHFSATHLDAKLLDLMISFGADINQLDDQNDNVLMTACKVLENDPCKFLSCQVFIRQTLGSGCDPLQKNNSNVCALELIDKFKLLNSKSIIKFLHNLSDERLLVASGLLFTTKEPAIITYLVSRGIDIDTLDREGNTPLLCAIGKKDLSLLQFLIDKGADTQVGLPFHIIARMGNIELLEFFFKLGRDINQLDQKGNNALMIACNTLDIRPTATQSYLFINKLLELGCSPLQKNAQGISPVEILLLDVIHYTKRLDTISLLILKGFPIDSFDCHGNTLLYKAVDALDLELIKFLVEKGANPELLQSVEFRKTAESPQALLEKKAAEYTKIVNLANLAVARAKLKKCDEISRIFKKEDSVALEATQPI